MALYISLKQKLIKPVISWREKLLRYNIAANSRSQARGFIKEANCGKLSREERKIAKAYWRSKGFKLNNALWHRYYKGITGVFMKEYLPDDIFRSQIAPKFNEMRQWPALLDKNLAYDLFKGFEHPNLVISNINGFFYDKGKVVSETEAIASIIAKNQTKLIIKPSIESGGGFMVKVFTPAAFDEQLRKAELTALIRTYKKDFIIQEFLDQSPSMAKLNESSLNTLRIMSFLRDTEVHIISTTLRIGKPGKGTDNFAGGGIACGVLPNGRLRDKAFTQSGQQLTMTPSGVVFKDMVIPEYEGVKATVKAMHKKVPYFRIISWDIGINQDNKAVLIEYNTYRQSTKIHQIPNGPLFGEFTEDILSYALNH